MFQDKICVQVMKVVIKKISKKKTQSNCFHNKHTFVQNLFKIR